MPCQSSHLTLFVCAFSIPLAALKLAPDQGVHEVRNAGAGTVPQTTAACGVIMVGAGSDAYVLKALKSAQHVAGLQMSPGWCAQDLQLTNVPVIYYHDRNISDAMITEAIGGSKPLFESFYIGSAENPVMKGFEAFPEKMSSAYFKWIRPQIFQLSPFKITLSVDDDAVPCSGAKFAEVFKFFEAQGKNIAAPKHQGGLNMGVVIFNTEMARPWAAAWANQMKHCIVTKGGVTNDQCSMNAVVKKTSYSIANFNDHNICRRAVRTSGCKTASCWIDHRPSSTPLDQKLAGADASFAKYEDSAEQHPGCEC